MDEIDIDSYRLPPGMTGPPKLPKRPPRHRQGERFLRGPIPWNWLQAAIGMPGKALHVAIVLWREAGCRKNRTVRFRSTVLRAMGIGPQAARRGLRKLEKAGLLTIGQKPGQSLEVIILDCPTPDRNGRA